MTVYFFVYAGFTDNLTSRRDSVCDRTHVKNNGLKLIPTDKTLTVLYKMQATRTHLKSFGMFVALQIFCSHCVAIIISFIATICLPWFPHKKNPIVFIPPEAHRQTNR